MCQHLEQVPTPVGETCLHCQEVILAADEGEMMVSGGPIHRECLIRMLIGSVGHQQGLCSCYGGDEEDPPGCTKHEAAKFATAYFETTRGSKWNGLDKG